MYGFKAPNKLLKKYHQKRIQDIHHRKMSNIKSTIDNKAPKTYPHLIVKLKQIQLEEERQAEVDHENKVLLHKMTNIMKNKPSVDYWNEYEPKSLNFVARERHLKEIQMENIGIARRLEKAKPVYDTDHFENDYQHKKYLQTLWNDNIKEYETITPRHLKYREMRKQMGDDNGEYDDMDSLDNDSGHMVLRSEKLPPLSDTKSKQSVKLPPRERSNKSDSQVDKLPKIDQNKQTEDGSDQGDHSHDRPKDTQLDQDCVALFKAAKQMAKPEEIFIKHLVRRSQKQRQQIKHRFPQLYDLNLVQELKQGLGKDWYLIIDGLLGDKSGSDCKLLHTALEKKDYSTAVEVLYFCDNNALTEMNNCYKKEYAVSIESDINEKSEEPERLLLLLLQKADKEESTSVDDKAAEADAQDLNESGDGRWTSDTGKFLMLLSTKSYSHIKAVLNTYKVLGGGRDITDDIKAECPKKYAETLCTLITCMRTPENHFADKLYKHHQATDPVLINVLLSRSEIDMTAIKKAYKKRYDADFIEDLRYKNKHPTIDVLVELTNRSAPMQSKGKMIQQKRFGGGVVSSPARKTVKRPDNKTKQSDIAEKNNSNPLSQPSQRVMADATQEKKEQEKAKMKEKQEKQEQLMQRKNISGTVKPATNFSADRDCEKLYKAMDGLGTDENVIVEIIPHRSNNQRQQLKKRYQEKYNKELVSDLESELTGDCEEIVLGLMMTPIEYDVHCLHEAIDGLGTTESTLIGILVTRNAKEKKAIQEQYKKVYKSDLEKDIISDTSGDFQNMLVALSKGERDQGTTVNQKEAQHDAKMLYRDGQPSVDIKDETFINIMVKKNHAQVKATFKEYEKIAGHDISTGIANAMLGDAEDGYIALAKAIEDPLEFYADRLKSCFGGLGTNDNMLIRICVSRSEIDLGDIMKCYQKLCNKTLAESIKKECSGDYKRLLLVIIGEEDQ
ncbi:hypothetical protein KUTeg_013675 [Tegillarca granosa]|uniref:Annexin n=1 Tax=Tegillarca granosa TaxID=220873 RepID=A0ABQ9EXW9_TEGGR|nr:hypothetical protein KUTeg_013675 [Tegillarca granosa]